MLSIPANQNRKIRILICTEVTVQEAFDQVTVNGVSSNILNLDAGLKSREDIMKTRMAENANIKENEIQKEIKKETGVGTQTVRLSASMEIHSSSI